LGGGLGAFCIQKLHPTTSMTDGKEDSSISSSADSTEAEAKENLTGFFVLLLEVDKRLSSSSLIS